MRIAIFSDVHGNPYALDAVLKAIDKERRFDYIVAAGDLAFGGSDPATCIDRIRERKIKAVYGNTEVYIHSPEDAPGDELHLKKWERLQQDAYWVRKQIGDNRIEWLSRLPFELKFSPSQKEEDNLLVFHANPKNVEAMIYPAYEDQLKLFGEIIQPDDDPELENLFKSTQEKTLAFGHYHYTSERYWKGRHLVNVAPVSMPAKDHDLRTRYTILEWDNAGWHVTRQYIEYDVSRELSALASSGMPHWRDHAATFAAKP